MAIASPIQTPRPSTDPNPAANGQLYDMLLADARAPDHIAGVPIQGTPSRVKPVGGIDRQTGRALQGDLMFGRTTSGQPIYWLQGRDSNYVLSDPATGRLLTNPADAEARARQLISAGAATRLRPLDPRFLAGAQAQRPAGSGAPATIQLDLEDRSVNTRADSHRGMFGTGFFVPYVNPDYTSTQAQYIAAQNGLSVTRWLEPTASWHDEPRAHAVVNMPNDERGGRIFARMNFQEIGWSGSQGSLKLPPGASRAFVGGFQEEARSIGVRNLVVTGLTVAYAASGLARPVAEGAGSATSTVRTGAVPEPANLEGAGSASIPMRLQPGKGTYEADLSLTRNVPATRTTTVPSRTDPTGLVRGARAGDNQGMTALPPSSRPVAAIRNGSTRSSQPSGRPAYTGPITLRKGVDLSHPGTFRLRSLDQMSKAFGVPKDELRVLVFVRHGESEANAGKRYAGNEIGLQDSQGGFVDPHPQQFTSLPTGELMRPGGQINLTAKGQQQARQAAPLIERARSLWGINEAQVSPVNRAQQTFELATNGGLGFDQVRTVQGLAERGQGSNIGRPKEGPGAPRPGDNERVPANRPVTDRTGAESVTAFEARQRDTLRKEVLPDLIEGKGLMQFVHQYTISGQLHALDPSVDTMEVGHHIPNGEPLVVLVRVHADANGQVGLSVLDAGYLKP